MILITTDIDLTSPAVPIEEISQADLNDETRHCSLWAEDVYFWRNGETIAIKRRDGPLVVPEWLENLSGVDR